MTLFSDSTKAVAKAVLGQAAGTVVGGAVFQVGCRVGNALYDGALALVGSVTGSDSK